MKKVISVTIGKIVFNVEEDAFEKLSDYLDSIRAHFKKDTEREEILEDIEISIAEKFLARQKNKDMAITLEDVETIIAKMGTVKDFAKTDAEFDEDEDEDDKEKSHYEKPIKRLYRNPDDKMIAGVCSGIAAYFGIDPVIVRLIFVVTVLVGGAGIIAYFILWIIVPEAENTAQKLEMNGSPVTLKQIEKTIKKEIDKLKKKDFKVVGSKFEDGFKTAFNGVFSVIGKIIIAVLTIVRIIGGIVLTIAGISGIFLLSFGTAWIVSGGQIPFDNYTAFNISDFITVSSVLLWFLIASIYILVLVPFFILFTTGISLLKKRVVAKPFFIIVLLALWFASLGITSSVAIQNAPQIKAQVERIENLEKVDHSPGAVDGN